MATFSEMFGSAMLLVVNTVLLICVTLCAGSILDWLSVWLGGQPAGYISADPIQGAFSLFYGLILAVEIALFVQFILVSIRRTDYSTQESDF